MYIDDVPLVAYFRAISFLLFWIQAKLHRLLEMWNKRLLWLLLSDTNFPRNIIWCIGFHFSIWIRFNQKNHTHTQIDGINTKTCSTTWKRIGYFISSEWQFSHQKQQMISDSFDFIIRLIFALPLWIHCIYSCVHFPVVASEWPLYCSMSCVLRIKQGKRRSNRFSMCVKIQAAKQTLYWKWNWRMRFGCWTNR